MFNYKHLSKKEREFLSVLLQNGVKQNKIAEILKRNPSTISREIKRNKTMIGIKNNNNPIAKRYLENSYYFLEKAQIKYMVRRKESKQGCPLKSLDLYYYVIEHLKQGVSPILISGRANLENRGTISHECIYQFIYGKDGRKLELWKNLPRHHKRRRKKRQRRYKRILIPNRVGIEYRPIEIETRKTFEHWEGDSIVGIGKGSALHTQIERKSRYVQIRKTKRKTVLETKEAMIDIFTKYPSYARQTSTEDNGSEFTKWESVKYLMDIYFATPYHSWERGSNERANGLVRRFFPKKTDFNKITKNEIQMVQEWINHRPMKCLNYKTPHEVFHEQFLLNE